MSCIDHGKKGDNHGYTMSPRKGMPNGKQIGLHRWVYCEANGLHPDEIKGKVIRHTCDNPRCINPNHLIIGSHQDNSDDMKERGRSSKGAAHPVSKLTPESVSQIRGAYVKGSREAGCSALAKQFGISRKQVHNIVTMKQWKPIK